MRADWVVGTVILPKEGAPPGPMMVMLPAAQAKVLDVWCMDGMAATGGDDILVEDVFIPEAFAARGVGRPVKVAGEHLHANPLYSVPMLPFLAMSAALPPIGAARSVVRAFRDRLGARTRWGGSAPLGELAWESSGSPTAVHTDASRLKEVYGGPTGQVFVECMRVRPTTGESKTVILMSHPIDGGAFLPLVAALAAAGRREEPHVDRPRLGSGLNR